MHRLAFTLLAGLVGAGIVHIVVLLLLPQFSERDAWSRLAMAADLYRVVRIDANAGQPPVVETLDPLFYAAACRFDLRSDAMYRAGELRMRIDGLGSDGDIGAVARASERDLASYAAACAGDEYRLVFERH